MRPAGSGQVCARPLTCGLLRVVMLMRSFAQRNGSVLLRGFIYGSKGVVSSGFKYTKQSRFAIPPSVFVPGDGKYLENVHIMCAPALLPPRLTCARTGTESRCQGQIFTARL